jgi:DNA-binding IclR family transcriptional regulator
VGAAGRAILAFLPDRIRRPLVENSPAPDAPGPRLEEIRKAGHACSRDELQEGVSGVAVPVFSAGFVTASLSVLVPVNRDAELQDWIADMSEAAERMSHELDAARRQPTE